MRRLSIVAAGLLSLFCSKKDAQNRAEPEPITAGSARSAAQSPKQEAPKVVRFALEKKFTTAAEIFPVGAAAVVCEAPCVFQEGPPKQTWLVDEIGVNEAPTLWPGSVWQRYLKKLEGRLEVSFQGEYPKLRAKAVAHYHPWHVLVAKLQNKRWGEVDRGPEDDAEALSRLGLAPRRYDAALLTAPVNYDPSTRLVYGAGGPTLLVSAKKLHVFEKESWATRDAPWGKNADARRLEGGGTLVLYDGGGYWVSEDLKVQDIEFEDPKAATSLSFLMLGKTVRVASAAKSLRLYRPVETAGLRAHTPEAREKLPQRRETGAVPPVSDGAVASSGMPVPVRFTSACKTPFVILATPAGLWDQQGGRDGTTGKGLAGHHELAPKLTFVAYRRGQTNYFGAQAKDEASARGLVALLQKNVPAMKPQLGCLDAVRHIGDPYTAPRDMQIVYLHLGSGREMPLGPPPG